MSSIARPLRPSFLLDRIWDYCSVEQAIEEGHVDALQVPVILSTCNPHQVGNLALLSVAAAEAEDTIAWGWRVLRRRWLAKFQLHGLYIVTI